MKRREKSLKEEREDPFFSHLPTTVQQKTPFTGGVGSALWKIQISKGGEEKGWVIVHRSRESRLGFSLGMEGGKVGKAACSELRINIAVKRCPRASPSPLFLEVTLLFEKIPQ